MKELVFIHEDVENLAYFSDANGVSAYNNRIILYAMQLSDIVGIFYTKKQAIEFYERNKFKSDLPIIYKFNQYSCVTQSKIVPNVSWLCDVADKTHLKL